MKLQELEDWYKQGGEMLVDDLLRERGWSWGSLGHNRKLELYKEAQKEVFTIKKYPPKSFFESYEPGGAKYFDASWMTKSDHDAACYQADQIIANLHKRK